MSAIYLQSRNAGKALLQLNLRHNQCSRGLEEPLQNRSCSMRTSPEVHVARVSGLFLESNRATAALPVTSGE